MRWIALPLVPFATLCLLWAAPCRAEDLRWRPAPRPPDDLVWEACRAAPMRDALLLRTADTTEKAGAGGGDDLLKQAQNPIANLISLPLWMNTSFGIGDTTYTAFVVPPAKGGFTRGAGPVVQLPTPGSVPVGTGEWGVGAGAVALVTAGKWVVGALAQNLWGVEGSDRLNRALIQYFINYYLPNGWFLVSAPILTADWNASSGSEWTIPFGGGVGKLIKVGPQPVNVTSQAYYDDVTPDGGPEWSIRLPWQWLFPAGT